MEPAVLNVGCLGELCPRDGANWFLRSCPSKTSRKNGSDAFPMVQARQEAELGHSPAKTSQGGTLGWWSRLGDPEPDGASGMGTTLVLLLCASLSPPALKGDTCSPSYSSCGDTCALSCSSHGDSCSSSHTSLCTRRMLYTYGCKLRAPLLHFGENLPPDGLNTSAWAPGSLHPISGGSGLEQGLLQPWKEALLTWSPPQGHRERNTSTCWAAFQGSAGSLRTLSSVLGEMLPEGKGTKTQNQTLRGWIPPFWGRLTCTRMAGNFFSPWHPHQARFLASISAGRACSHPIFPAGKGHRRVRQSCKSHNLTESGADSVGVPHALRLWRFALFPWEPQQHPLMCFKPQQQLRNTSCPALEGARAQGHLAQPSPGRYV
ncbi:uncharacterized protein LOC128854086 [Cuculus canorus]|uniref:uncharacterized protein LOC128854086 n=1 Tax=Cuculus canorus TaxID=55661 RepID=UPI0023AA78BD|nr:uncharacterized protein LOC128854086 [Cuculus canorus]